VSLLALRLAVEEACAAAPTPAERGRVALAHMDRVESSAPRACAAGCAFCCHLPVLVTPSEAAVLAETVARLPGIRERLREPRGNRCPLLGDDDRCLAYDARPLRCRAHTSPDAAACEREPESALTLGDPWLRGAAVAIRRAFGEPERGLREALRELLGD